MRVLPLLALLLGCPQQGDEPEVQVGSLTLQLLTPSADDAMEGVDTLAARVLDHQGLVLAEAEGDTTGLSLPELDFFGIVEVEVTGLANGEVISAGRSGPVWIQPDQDQVLSMPWLPVNKPVLLAQDPVEDRILHRTLLSPDGRVLLIGGREPSTTRVHWSTEWWSLEEGFSGYGPDLPDPLFDTTEAWLGEDLLLVGGRSLAPPATEPVASTLRVSLDGQTIEALDEMERPRQGHCLAAVEGAALALGGLEKGEGEGEGRTLEVLRQPVGEDELLWDEVLMEELVVEDVGSCTGTSSGYVVTTGREDEAWGVLDTRKTSQVEIARSFARLQDQQDPLWGAIMVPLDEDRVWVLGGWDGASARTDAWMVYAVEKRRTSSDAGLFRQRGGAQWRWWREEEVIVVYGGYQDPNRIQAVRSLELVDVEEGSVLELTVPVGQARMEVVQGGMILLTGGVRATGEESGAWAVMPWLDE